MNNLLISLIVFLTYTVGITIKYGVQESISASWYKLNRVTWIFFTLFTWGTALPILMLDLGMFYTLGAISLMFVGVAGAFRNDKMIKGLHLGFTYSSILFFCFALVLDGIWKPAALTVIFVVSTTVIDMKNKIWWDEVFVYFAIMTGILKLMS